jgi:cytosine/adenosine deaminase-related metal-dependent hydrolase
MGYMANMVENLGTHFRPEGVYEGNLLGSLEALNAGVTTIVDWSHISNSPDHADEAIRGLRDAGIRAVYAHGDPNLAAWTCLGSTEALTQATLGGSGTSTSPAAISW